MTVSDFAAGPVRRADRRHPQRRRRDQRGLRAGPRAAAGRPLRQPLGHHLPAHRQGRLVPAGPARRRARRRGRRRGRAGVGRRRRAAGADSSAPSAGAMSELMQTSPDPYADDPLPDFATDLLTRVAEMVGAAGGAIRLDRGDGQGHQVLARYGRQPRPGNELLRVPLAVHRPYAGELELDAAPSAYARPLAVLAAERLVAAPGERPAAPGRRPPAGLADLPGRGERAARPVAGRRADHGADPAAGGAPARPVVRGAHHRRVGPAAARRGQPRRRVGAAAAAQGAAGDRAGLDPGPAAGGVAQRRRRSRSARRWRASRSR